MSMLKTGIDSAYAYRFIRLMQKDFNQWKAFEYGLIDDRGTILKRPKTPDEKSAYTPFHASIRSLKRTMATVPGLTTWVTMQSALSAIGSRFSLTESDWKLIAKELGNPIFEEMVAGDDGDGTGSPESIASGTTTGALTKPAPAIISKRRRAIIGKF